MGLQIKKIEYSYVSLNLGKTKRGAGKIHTTTLNYKALRR
jgi:hypothetical protein